MEKNKNLDINNINKLSYLNDKNIGNFLKKYNLFHQRYKKKESDILLILKMLNDFLNNCKKFSENIFDFFEKNMCNFNFDKEIYLNIKKAILLISQIFGNIYDNMNKYVNNFIKIVENKYSEEENEVFNYFNKTFYDYIKLIKEKEILKKEFFEKAKIAEKKCLESFQLQYNINKNNNNIDLENINDNNNKLNNNSLENNDVNNSDNNQNINNNILNKNEMIENNLNNNEEKKEKKNKGIFKIFKKKEQKDNKNDINKNKDSDINNEILNKKNVEMIQDFKIAEKFETDYLNNIDNIAQLKKEIFKEKKFEFYKNIDINIGVSFLEISRIFYNSINKFFDLKEDILFNNNINNNINEETFLNFYNENKITEKDIKDIEAEKYNPIINSMSVIDNEGENLYIIKETLNLLEKSIGNVDIKVDLGIEENKKKIKILIDKILELGNDEKKEIELETKEEIYTIYLKF